MDGYHLLRELFLTQRDNEERQRSVFALLMVEENAYRYLDMQMRGVVNSKMYSKGISKYLKTIGKRVMSGQPLVCRTALRINFCLAIH